MPGQTRTITWTPKKAGIYPFYCTDFCSALHQEMQGYIRVSPANSRSSSISFGEIRLIFLVVLIIKFKYIVSADPKLSATIFI